jgi:hypothetical protein
LKRSHIRNISSSVACKLSTCQNRKYALFLHILHVRITVKKWTHPFNLNEIFILHKIVFLLYYSILLIWHSGILLNTLILYTNKSELREREAFLFRDTESCCVHHHFHPSLVQYFVCLFLKLLDEKHFLLEVNYNYKPHNAENRA